jgi:hypothetical protein
MSESLVDEVPPRGEIPEGESDPPCWQNLTFLVSLALFPLTRLFNWAWRPGPVAGGDTPMYLPSGDQTRFQLVDFFGNRSRPGVMTGLFAVLQDPERIVLVQHLVSAVAWLVLLIVVVRMAPLPRGARAVSALGIAAVASLPAVTSWNDVLMSESFSLSWMAALSVVAVFVWSRQSVLSQRSWMVVGVSAAIFTALLGPLRPLSLGFALVLLAAQAIVVVKGLRGAPNGVGSATHRLRAASGSLVGLAVLFGAVGYVAVVDSRANYAWGQEFAGLDDFNGRAIQQLTVVSDSSQWAYDAYWHYINSVGDPCVEAGFEAGQYWPATAMQCPDGIRELAETFQRHYLVDYLRSLPLHFDETLRDFRTGWAYLSHPPGYGADPIPDWARWMLMNPEPSSKVSPVVFVLAFALAALLLASVLGWERTRRGSISSRLRCDARQTVVPSALFVVSLLAVVVTIIVSPGDPRVAIVHATSSRVWAILGFAAIVSALVNHAGSRSLGTSIRLPQEADARDE